MTTKQQEMKALEQIKKIVASLGEDSYIGAAFEGCFEIAESNISNDWACSMKQRAESAEQSAEVARIAKRDAQDAMKRWQQIAEKANAATAAAQQEASSLRDKLREQAETLHDLDIAAAQVREHTSETYRRRIDELLKLRVSAADTMAAYIDHPQDIAYTHAVQLLKKYKAESDELEAGLKLIQKLGE